MNTYDLSLIALRVDESANVPEMTLNLLVDAPNKTIMGISQIAQSTDPSLRLVLHVTGNLATESETETDKVRLDIKGWPDVYWPGSAGASLAASDLKATVFLSPDYSQGMMRCKFRTDPLSDWTRIEQPIHKIGTI